jgi:putative membrane-bound dehydrogenase-like protein
MTLCASRRTLRHKGITMNRRALPLVALVPILILAQPAYPAGPPPSPKGVLPLGSDGRPLNLDFETGTLKDWTATGTAFAGQPVKGDTVHKRRSDMRSRHQGNFWIGTYERKGDPPQGTLTSAAFTVTHPWASFLVGGGPHTTTCVELVRADTSKVFFRASGREQEDMHRVIVDLRPLRGKKMLIRLVDRHSGHWGHINFDDFRFHAGRPHFAPPPGLLVPDVYPYAGLPPKKAAQVMTVPKGFTVKLFAGEPDVGQPIALCLDDRGRVWVAEAHSYPIRQPRGKGKDRIVIFEDTTGKGTFDKRTVFMEGLNLVSGLEVGHGGVWIGAAPYLLFVPVNKGEDRPAGKPKVLLDGWGYQDTHETLNTFSWGPDGWLYGCHGVFTHSRVGKPGTPAQKRVPINAGIWRYHPTKHIFEVFAEGTSNPWGLDFDDHGQAFCEVCVIPHAFHVIQGGRYQRQAGSHFNPHTYADLRTIADHLHYLGASPWGGNDRSDSAGGGHAHCGTMIYLGGAWPAHYRGRMFMGNIHGRRINTDVLRRTGSGFVASHGPDFLKANDAWARFINLRYGPDGNVFLIDWYDKQACHTNNDKVWDRSNGRIYKVVYRGTKSVKVDLGKRSNKELVALQLHANDWYVRHARRLLQERGPKKEVHEALAKIAFGHADEVRRLRGLWALHATGGLTQKRALKGLTDGGAYVRAWTVQLALEDRKPSSALLEKLAELARKDRSPVVRLYLASGLRRLPLAKRWDILAGLLGHAADADDPNLPLMYWYAAEPLAKADAARALALAARSRVPALLPFMVRRVAALGTSPALALLLKRLGQAEDARGRLLYLRAMQQGLEGQRDLPRPSQWAKVFAALSASTDAEVRNRAVALGAAFGDPRAFDELRRVLADGKTRAELRRQALAALVAGRDAKLPLVLHKLVSDRALRGDALRALAAFDHARTPAVVLSVYSSLNSAEKRDALGTLASRPAYGKALLEAVAARKVPAGDVSAELVRQLRNLKDKALDKRIAEVWGIVRTTPADRAKMIAYYRTLLKARPPAAPDPELGRAIFAKVCAQCHTLFGTGGKVGPDITGANRASLDYLLENILDPSAVIPKEYAVTVLTLTSGRTITGIVRGETPVALTVVTANETLTVPLKDVESRAPSRTSMMPDDLLKGLADHDVRSLIAYLQSPKQVPILATPHNARELFNGKDLTGWDGDPKLWRVVKGEIVGKSPGIKHNAFLRSHMSAADFRLRLKVKLVPDRENSGVQFRSAALPGGEMKGPQADIGAGWWGKLYDENGRGLLWKKPGDKLVKRDAWNDYEVVCRGSRIRTYLNGKLCVDLDDPAGPRRGIFAFQIHSGGPLEVRFKDIKLEVLGSKKK